MASFFTAGTASPGLISEARLTKKKKKKKGGKSVLIKVAESVNGVIDKLILRRLIEQLHSSGMSLVLRNGEGIDNGKCDWTIGVFRRTR